MTEEVTLDGLRVRLGTPRQVLEAVGHCWFPNIARFPSGTLMATAILSADSNSNLVDGYRVTGSKDGGQTWSRPYDVAGWGGGCVSRIAQPDGSVAGPDYWVYPDPPGQARRFAGHFERFDDAASSYTREPFALRVEGIPRDVRLFGEHGTWSKDWAAHLTFYGNYIEVHGEVLTTTHLVYQGESRYTQIALTSADRGRTWRYLSTVAPSETAPDAKEGPNESSVIQLENGDLMCVMRVGRLVEGTRGPHSPLARAYSVDGGRSWSSVDRLPVSGVAPCMRRLSSGAIALTTGRPGISLWVSNDARGEQWQEVDLLAHHNAALDARHFIWPGDGSFDPNDPSKTAVPEHLDPISHDQTTAYTHFVEIAPNHILVTYDRVPYSWRPVPTDVDERNRIYVMEIGVEQV